MCCSFQTIVLNFDADIWYFPCILFAGENHLWTSSRSHCTTYKRPWNGWWRNGSSGHSGRWSHWLGNNVRKVRARIALHIFDSFSIQNDIEINLRDYFWCREVKGTDATTGVHGSRRIMGGSAISSAGTSGITTRRTNLRSSSGCGSTQRLSGGNRDHSVTQFALIDDENVSALQQVRNIGRFTHSEQSYFRSSAYFAYPAL